MNEFRDACIRFVLTNPDMEGGAKVVNSPDSDPGGLTRFGFSQRSYPNADIANLTLETAMDWAVRDYWNKCRCGELPPRIAAMVFDFALNSGMDASIKMLQACIGVRVDGRIGPITLAAAAQYNGSAEYMAARALRFTQLQNFKPNARGWFKRLFVLQDWISRHG